VPYAISHLSSKFQGCQLTRPSRAPGFAFALQWPGVFCSESRCFWWERTLWRGADWGEFVHHGTVPWSDSFV